MWRSRINFLMVNRLSYYILAISCFLPITSMVDPDTYGAFALYNYQYDNPNERFDNVGAFPDFDFLGISYNGGYWSCWCCC